MNKCKHCEVEFDLRGQSKRWMANHSRWCSKNPKRQAYANALDNARSCIKTPRNQYIVAKEAGVKLSSPLKGKPGKTGPKHSEESISKIREGALNSPHRRLLRSIRTYIKKDGSVVKLDSGWEEALAIRLDSINVAWDRPKPVRWVDKTGIGHNYFPDFYLPEFDLFLDPKNPYAIRSQLSKLECLKVQLPNLVLLTSLEECNTYLPLRRTNI